MGELGRLLREARQRNGVSLKEAEEATKIRQKYLRALEEQDYAVLPDPVYRKGLLRSYALYLGVDLQEAMALYEGKRAEIEVEPEEATAIPVQVVKEPLGPSPWLTLDLLIGVAILLAMGIFGVWAFRRYLLPTAMATPTPHTALPIDLTLVPTNTPSPTNTPLPTPTSKVYTGVEVEVEIVERTFLRVLVDGEMAFEGIVDAGDTQTWIGRERIAIISGNAGGVVVTVNGEFYGPLGERAQTVAWEWVMSPEGMLVMGTPQPTSTPTPELVIAAPPTPPPTPSGPLPGTFVGQLEGPCNEIDPYSMRVRGWVLDTQGNGMAGVEVLLLSPGPWKASVSTYDDGSYAFDGLNTAAEYTVTLTGYLVEPAGGVPVFVDHGKECYVTFRRVP